jgi:hypothetical protein
LALSAALGVAACGGAEAPGGPGPLPSASPTPPAAGGVVAGNYILQVTPAAGCVMRNAASFPMAASAGGTMPHPGVQVVLRGSDVLQIEFLSTGVSVTGGLGTTEQGALANESVRVWLRAIGTGPVERAADGRGQIVAGRMAGYLAYGSASGGEGTLGSCDSLEHSFTLRVQ